MSDNELIAEFMGNLRLYQVLLDPKAEFKTWRHADYKNFTFDEATSELPKIKAEGYPDAEIVFVGGTTKFHSSWDWLMPVVEKIAKVGYSPFILSDKTAYIEGKHLSIHTGDSSLEATYKAVVEFIKWYNTLNKTK